MKKCVIKNCIFMLVFIYVWRPFHMLAFRLIIQWRENIFSGCALYNVLHILRQIGCNLTFAHDLLILIKWQLTPETQINKNDCGATNRIQRINTRRTFFDHRKSNSSREHAVHKFQSVFYDRFNYKLILWIEDTKHWFVRQQLSVFVKLDYHVTQSLRNRKEKGERYELHATKTQWWKLFFDKN